MTIGWAIIMVAVLFLLDKYNLLKKAVKITAIGAVVLGVVWAGLLGFVFLNEKWEEHQFVKTNECFDSTTGKVHAVQGNDNYTACEEREIVHKRGTPLPVIPKCVNPFSDLGGIPVAGEEFSSPQGPLLWNGNKWCAAPITESSGKITFDATAIDKSISVSASPPSQPNPVPGKPVAFDFSHAQPVNPGR